MTFFRLLNIKDTGFVQRNIQCTLSLSLTFSGEQSLWFQGISSNRVTHIIRTRDVTQLQPNWSGNAHFKRHWSIIVFFCFVLHPGHCEFAGESLDILIFLRYCWQIQSLPHGHDYLSSSNFNSFAFFLSPRTRKQYVKSILFLKGFSWKSKAILQSLIVVTFKDMKSKGLCNSIHN